MNERIVPAITPGMRERKDDVAKRAPRARAQAQRGLLDRAVDAFEHRLQRQHDERQVDRDDADDDRELGVHDLQRLAR